jgi:hypothetical protein
MPPGHGHGGGHGGGGHRGGGHHHGHGGGRPGGWQGGWGPGWSGPGYWGAQPAYAELVVPSCPDIIDQVIASDGRTYLNSCLANQAGARVVKHLGAQKVAGLGDLFNPVAGILPGIPNIALVAGAGIAAYMVFRLGRKKGSARTTAQTVARIRTVARTRR